MAIAIVAAGLAAVALPAFADGPGDPAWVAQMLAAHNSARAQVGVPPLTWSTKLSAYAQAWAQSSAAAGTSEHRTDNTYGENLFWTSGTAVPGDVVGAWVAEVQNYNYAANSCSAVCGHYTQVVWKTTTQVGCGLATSAQGQYWVCNYDPPGNYEGQQPY